MTMTVEKMTTTMVLPMKTEFGALALALHNDNDEDDEFFCGE